MKSSLIGIALVLFVLLSSAYVESRKPEYAPQIVYGIIVSDGIIQSSRGTTGPIDPVVMVACDDKILARVTATNSTLAQGYKLIQGERVKLRRRKTIGLIPFLESDDYVGWLTKIE